MSTSADVQWIPVRELGEVRMGKQLSPSSREAADQFPYLRVANVHLGRIEYFDVNEMGFTSAERLTYGLKPGDILLNEGQSLELVGRSAIYERAEGEFFFQNTLIRFRPNGRIFSAYAQMVFEHWLRSGVFAAIAKQTTSIAHLGGDRFAALKFPLLPIGMQQRIVDGLESLAELERGVEASIAKLRTARDAIFSRAVASAAYGAQETRTVSLGSLLERVEAGWSPACDTEPPRRGEWGVVRVSAVTSGRFAPHESKRLPPNLSPRPDLEIRCGDLLMARANGARNLVGTVCLVGENPGRLMLSDKTLRLLPKDNMARTDFLSIALSAKSVRNQIEAMLSGSTGQGNISQTAVRSIVVPKISVREQREIVKIVGSVDRNIVNETSELAKLCELKSGLVDDLLTGRVAVSAAGTEE